MQLAEGGRMEEMEVLKKGQPEAGPDFCFR